MGFLDKLRKKSGPEPGNNDDIKTVGWDAITDACLQAHPNRRDHHMATIIKYALGGPDPLDGVSIYVLDDHWHYVTYGFSELYSKDSDDPEESGWGFELTYRLRHDAHAGIDDDPPPTWPIQVLQGLARYVFSTGAVLRTGEHLDLSHLLSDFDDPIDVPGFALIQDPQLGEISTPHGKVEFRQCVSVTEDELTACKTWNTSGVMELLSEGNPLLVSTSMVDRNRFGSEQRAAVERGADVDGSSYSRAYADDLSIEGEVGSTDGPLLVSFAPIVAAEVRLLLRRRLGFGKSFLVLRENTAIVFEPSEEGASSALRWDEDGDPNVVLSTNDAFELSARLSAVAEQPGPHRILVPGVEHVTIQVNADDSFYRD